MYPQASTRALKDISLEVKAGEFVGIIGATGAGKTTLCLTFNGIVPQFYGGRFFGHVTVAGLDTLDHPISVLAQHVGMVFEDPETQVVTTSVENEIAFALENLNVPRKEIKNRIRWALDIVRLKGLEQKPPHALSSGQKQRLAIAAALALRPNLLVLDEPTSQLDPQGVGEVFTTARELNEEHGVTVIMTGQAAEELAKYSDRIILLSDGGLVMASSPDDVYAQVPLLERQAIRPPQVAQTFYLLKKRGGPIQKIPVRLEEGVQVLTELRAMGTMTLNPHSPLDSTQPVEQPLLSTRALTHTYPDGSLALRGVTLDIHKGDYVLIAGQNGAGKSTLIKHFLKLLEPTTGHVLLDGMDIAGDSKRQAMTTSALAQRIGYVAQNPDTQIFNTTVEEEVTFALRNLDYSSAEIKKRADASLGAMGLLAQRDRHPFALPKGDRARVVIAAILALEPEVIIFDEPTTGQDYRGARYILEFSQQLHRRGKTIIVITHHLYLMPPYAERAIFLNEGQVLLDAPLREAYYAIAHLSGTALAPPQAVVLAQALCPEVSPGWLTPEEIAIHVSGSHVCVR